MNNNFKKTVLIDLDGVLNNYCGNYDENIIPSIKEGAKNFIRDLSKKFKIKIFTSRNLLKSAKWVFDNKLEKYIDDITNIKETSYLIIDDRCINFKGDYKELEEKIARFKAWYRE